MEFPDLAALAVFGAVFGPVIVALFKATQT
jgi:hypothetical protein